MPSNKDIQTLDAIYKAIEKTEIAIIDNKIVRILQWKIIKVLGEGATATVYLGQSLIDETMVAIKVFKSEYFSDADLNDSNQKMMRTEAALVGMINHPNILQTYSVGINSDPKYMVMEFVDYGSLEDYINPPKTISLGKLIKIFFQCGCAFQYSDEIGVIHRDVKPANILLSEGKIPKITDYGSSMVKGMDKDAVSGVGSPTYMSSEQIRQEILNQQTDIYSLGATFFELLTGKKIVEADNQKDLIYKILFVEPPPVSQFITSQLPEGLEAIVQKCLKKKQDERYQSWIDYIVDMVKLIYRITPKNKYLEKIDEVTAFDWVRKCPAMEIFEDSELWDLIQGGFVYKVGCGMAFSIAKFVDPDEQSISLKELDKNELVNADLVSEDNYKSFIEGDNNNLVHTFVLNGVLQSYGTGGDGRIQILRSGDYCANIALIDSFNSNLSAQAFSVEDTVLINVEESSIRAIHPVVRDKLNSLINKSQQNQMFTLKQRHTKLEVHSAVKDASRDMRLL